MGRLGTMRRIAGELVVLVLAIACPAGTAALILAAHLRPSVPKADSESPSRAIPPVRIAEIEPEPVPVPPVVANPPTSVDPTAGLVAERAEVADRLRREALEASAKAVGLESEIERVDADARQIREDFQVKAEQVQALADEVRRAATEADAYARQRDILANRVESERAEREKQAARARDSYAILPYKGPNGTWQRPLVIDCRDNQVKLLPHGPTFASYELSSGRMRSSPIRAAVARTLAAAEREESPDGSRSVPYLLFLVRPDGIEPYYEARAALEPLGIAFGYELIDDATPVDVPDLSDPSEWPGATPRPSLAALAPGVGDPSAHPYATANSRGSAVGLGTPTDRSAGSGLFPTWSENRSTGIGSVSPAGGGGSPELGPSREGESGLRSDRMPTGATGTGLASERPAGPILAQIEGQGPAMGGDRVEPGDRPGTESGSSSEASSAFESQSLDNQNVDNSPYQPGWRPPGVAPTESMSDRNMPPGSLSDTSEHDRYDENFAGLSAQNRWSGASSTGGGGQSIGAVSPLSFGGGGGGGGSGSGGGDGGSGRSGGGNGSGPGSGALTVMVRCRAGGVIVEPGGYRISGRALAEGELFPGRLRAIASAERRRSPSEEFQPSIRFFVEPGGESTFWEARRQSTFNGLNWPTTVRLAESGGLSTHLGVFR